MAFKKAERQKQKLRMALYGPSGSGKTWTALAMAKVLGSKIGVIDTERGSASLYVGKVADFETNELATFAPGEYIKAMKEAAQAGFDVLVIDSLSHGWMGKGGLLDQADAKGGRFDAWKTLTPQQQDLVDSILAYPGHVIATMRAKTEYAVDKDDRGKTTVSKLGLAPIQKADLEYEFTIAGLMDQENTLHVTKSRCGDIVPVGAALRKPGADLALKILAWLDSGAEVQAVAVPPAPATPKPLTIDERIASARAKLAAITTRADFDAFTRAMKSPTTPDEIRLALSTDWVAKGSQFSEPDAAQ